MFFKRYISKDVTAESITSAFRHVPSKDEELQQKGEISVLITVSGDGSFQADRAVKFVWDGVLDGYLYGDSTSMIDSVKDAINAGSRKLLELMKNDKELEEKGINLSFAVSVIKDKTAYLGVFGEEEVYVYKNGDFVNISEILSENKVTVASVALEDQDLVLLGSPMLVSSFSKVIDSGTDPEELIKRLGMFADDLTGNQGILLLSRKEYAVTEPVAVVEEKEEAEEEPEQEDGEDGKDGEDMSPEIHGTTPDSLDEQAPADPEEKVEEGSEKKTEMTKFEQFKEKLSGFVSTVSEKSEPIISALAAFLGRIGNKIRGVLDDRYGRKAWYKRLLSRFSALRFSRDGAQGMRLDGYKIKGLRNKRFVSLGLIVLAILVIIGGVRLSINAKEARELHREAVTVAEAVDGYIETAERNLSADKGAAETAIFQANEELEKLDGKDLSIDDGKLISDLKNKLQAVDDRLNKRVALEEGENFDLFLNTKINLHDQSNPTDIAIFKDDFQNEFIIIADNGAGEVYRISTFDRTAITKIPDGNEVISAPRFVDWGVEGVYVYDDTNGVVKSPFNSNKENEDFVGLVGLGVSDVGAADVVELAIFTQSDNVYLLSNSEQAVLKSNRTGSGGYGLPYTYISNESLATGTDFFGDISIYALTAGAQGLERYTFNFGSGEAVENSVAIVGVTPEFENLTAGYTGATLDNYLYAFDAKGKRVLVFEKPKESLGDALHPNEMWLVSQYVYRGDNEDVFGDVQDLVVDFAENNLYILDGESVWKVELE